MQATHRLFRMLHVRHFLVLIWGLVAILGSVALAFVVGLVNPQEKVNGLWLVVAAACIYVLAFRFYGRWISRRVVELNDQRVTPAVRLNDGINFHPTNKYVLFGHHFAAIAGAGPLLGPVLAAQFGFLARLSLAGDRCGVGAGGAGLHHPGCVDAAEWPLTS